MSALAPTRAAAALAVALLVGRAAAAQPFTERYIVAGVSGDTPPVGIACGTDVLSPGPGVSSATCGFGGGTFQVIARALGGHVGALAHASGSGPGGPTSRTYNAVARAQWGDQLIIEGPLPASMSIGLTWEGSLSATATGDAGSGAQAAWVFQGYGPGAFQEYYGGADVFASGLPVFTGHPTADFETVHDERVFVYTTVPAYLNILISLFTSGTVSIGGSQGGGTAIGDFDQTGFVSSLAFFDAAGNDITGSVAYSFVNGTVVGPIATAVPEPATLALFGGGLVLLAAAARRRRA
jgi:hypothetical protein